VVLFRHHLVYLRIETWLGCGTIQLEAQMGTLPERISFKKIKKNYDKRENLQNHQKLKRIPENGMHK
jgi:hypothetical protein